MTGIVERDEFGDLQAKKVRIEMRIEGRLMVLEPINALDRAHLAEILLNYYEFTEMRKPMVDAV